MSCEENFFSSLRDRGLRLTPQRKMILSALHELGQLATAEEIFQHVQKSSSSLDISTVYRTLELLKAFRIVTCIQGGDGQYRYELAHHRAPHIHLVCRSCGRVFEAAVDDLQPFISAAWEHHSFKVDVNTLSVRGLCRECCARVR
ncbi:MAG: Fur family transcriptional regulator [Anaerolineae bacterium]